jgi:putative peptidoglycan lipid II flippase
MVKRIFSIFHKEISGLHQAAYLLGFFALCSQVLALFRDRLLAAHFGATGTLDLYYSAFRIPDFLFATVASIVSISVLMPYLMDRMDKSNEEAKKFIDAIFSFFFLFMFIVGLLAFLLAPFFLKILFPPFAGSASFGSLVLLTRILLLSPIFLGFSNTLATIVQINKRFFLYSMSPIVYNLGIIFGILFLYPVFGLTGLGFGVVIGAFLHFAIQMPFIIKQGLMPRLHFPIDFTIIKNVVYTSIPRTLTVSSNEIAELVLISFASFLVPGSISIFNFSFNLQSVPFSIIGVSYSLAAFPTLTKFFSKGNIDMFIDHMITSSRHIIFWSVPVSMLFIVLRAQIVRVILGSGQFNWGDTRLTAAALAIFVASLTFQNLTPLFVRSYYSRGKTKVPLYMNMFSSAVIISLAYYLVNFFNHNLFFQNFMESLLKVPGVPGTAMLMLPLGFSLGVLVNCVIHWIGFGLEFRSFSKPVLRTLFEVVASSIIMGFVAYLGLNFFGPIFNTDTVLGVFLQGFLSGVSGIIVAVLILYLLKSRELSEVWSTLHKKIWKATVVLPDATLD